MDLWLTVETLSETAPGSGESDAGLVDRDIVHDPTGLPYLPARRIKGALREAADEVVAVLRSAGVNLEEAGVAAVDDVFGRSGAGAPGWLRLENLHLDGAAETHAWLEIHRTALAPAQVLSAFTSVRTQTRIDADRGVAQEDTLRRTRVLRRGLVFAGRADLVDAAVAPAATRTLALACAALRRLGLSRNRGLGRVRVRLYADSSRARDLTTEALGWLDRLAAGRA